TATARAPATPVSGPSLPRDVATTMTVPTAATTTAATTAAHSPTPVSSRRAAVYSRTRAWTALRRCEPPRRPPPSAARRYGSTVGGTNLTPRDPRGRSRAARP